MTPSLFGKKFRGLRVAKDLTYWECAKVMGVSVSTIQNWERGKLADPVYQYGILAFLDKGSRQVVGVRSPKPIWAGWDYAGGPVTIPLSK